MEDLIRDRLGKVSSLDDKALLKDLLAEILIPMHEQLQSDYQRLEQKVKDELPLSHTAFTIYSTLVKKDAYESNHAFLRPVAPSDLQETTLKLSEIDKGAQRVIGGFFILEDYLKVKKIIAQARRFEGFLITPKGKVEFKCSLTLSDKYIKQVEHIHKLFIANGIPWVTVNTAYFGKYAEATICDIDMPEDFDPKTTVTDVEIDFGELQSSIFDGLIPVWNVEKHHIKSVDFPVPAGDKINYEYHYDLTKLGLEHGYLVDMTSGGLISQRRDRSTLTAVSSSVKGAQWDMFRIIKRKDHITDSYLYPLVSNWQEESFSARLMEYYGATVKTRAELDKLVNSFEAAQGIALESVKLMKSDIQAETYSMNPFIEDEIRISEPYKSLVLYFKAQGSINFISRDNMSFVVSQVQCIYPEYQCVGVLR